MPNDVRVGPGDGKRDLSLPSPMCPTLQPLHRGQHPPPHTAAGSASVPRAQEQEGLLGQKQLEGKGKLRHSREKGLGQRQGRALGCGIPAVPGRGGGLSETKKQGLPTESSTLPCRCLPQFPHASQAQRVAG